MLQKHKAQANVSRAFLGLPNFTKVSIARMKQRKCLLLLQHTARKLKGILLVYCDYENANSICWRPHHIVNSS